MAYIISERARKIMRTFYHDNGNNSFFALLEKDGNLYLFKFFDCFRDELCEKLRIIERFKDLKYNGLNAFPLDSFLLEDEMNECPENGYVCKYYKDAHDFKDLMYNEMVQSIPYPVRYQATLDISKQLAFIHELGFIYNDMRFSNCMISPQLGHGFLVDFEDMILEDEFKIKKSYYRFTDKDTNNKCLPSKIEDVKKQFICNLSILLDRDLEFFVINKDEWQLLDKLSFDKEIYEFARCLFEGDELLYFDQIAHCFLDEEKVSSYQKKIGIKN